MKLKSNYAAVFLTLVALGGFTSSKAVAQKKKKALAQEKTTFHVFKDQNGQLVEVDTLVQLTEAQLAKHQQLLYMVRQQHNGKDILFLRPSKAGSDTLRIRGFARTFTGLEGQEGARHQLLRTLEDSTKERTVKLRIIKKENDTFYALDTTLVVPAGVSQMTAMKGLKLDERSMTALGAKPLETSEFTVGDGLTATRIFSKEGKNTVKAITIQSISSDSSFKIVNGKITVSGQEGRRWVTSLDEKDNPLLGHTFYLRKSLNGDSLAPSKLLGVPDSMFRIRIDSLFANRSIFIEKDSASGIKVVRIRENGKLGDVANFRLAVPAKGETRQIIVLRSSPTTIGKKGIQATGSKEAKAGKEMEVRLYPNPTSGRFTVSFTIDKKSDTRLRVVDSTGKTVLEENAGLQKGTFTRDLDLSRFGKGVYILQILSGKNVRSERIVVQ
ncbi:T9SS type A sorting domain-containing protein [Nibribacter ruber]|uniref:T9SS type A sorting domain-containing protein n=1 Tax=Nibribacter ruber TaxID=2698458 RepID=A0A6P1NS79_9BACT|nr:T9SS type A sorting domain-containing protein [Nibribacter ruber]QHL86527.1 T9SS type A sorting domain-containing protein [Nibribacter ruber]